MDWLQVAIGIIVGGVITAVASWYYYMRAAKDLQEQAEDLLKYNAACLDHLERLDPDFGAIRDSEGRPTHRRVHRLTITDSVGVSDTGGTASAEEVQK